MNSALKILVGAIFFVAGVWTMVNPSWFGQSSRIYCLNWWIYTCFLLHSAYLKKEEMELKSPVLTTVEIWSEVLIAMDAAAMEYKFGEKSIIFGRLSKGYGPEP